MNGLVFWWSVTVFTACNMKNMMREYSITAKKILDQVIDFFFVAIMVEKGYSVTVL